MRRFIIKVVLLFSIIIGILLYLSSFVKPDHHYLNTVNDYNDLIKEGKDVDVAIYGSSHAYCSYNPLVIDSITKTRSFNFGNDAQRLAVSKYILKETLKKINPKLIIVDVYPASIADPEGEKAYSFQEKSYYYFDLSFNKIVSAIEVFPKEKAVEVILPGLKRKDYQYNFKFSKNYVYAYPAIAKATPYKGFVGFDLKSSEKLKLLKKSVKNLKDRVGEQNKEYNRLTFKEESNIKEFVEIAKSSQAKVLFVVAPYYAVFNPKANYAGFHNYMKEFCGKTGVEFLDLNLLWDELELNADDFKDGSHLNLRGSGKISKYLGTYIDRHYDIPSRANDREWIAEQPRDLGTYLSGGHITERRVMDADITKDVHIESLAIAELQGLKKVIIELGDKVTDSIIRQYTWGLHTFVVPEDEDRLMAYSKARNRKYDAWDFNPEITEVDGKKYIVKTLNTPITSFTKVKMFLYDRSGYKGVRGETIEIDSMMVR